MGFLNAHVPVDERGKKILNEFNDVEELSEVIDGILSLNDSKIYERVYKASMEGHEMGISVKETENDLLKMPQVKLASEVLKDPPLYLPPLNDVIISIHFISTMHVIIWRYYTCINRDLSHNDLLKAHTTILERLISLLDDFDKMESYQAPDKEFYQKLKKVKWNKEGKALFKRISDLKFEINFEKFGSGSSTFRTGENFALTFLAACNAVHHDRNRMLKEDVVVAYKAYLKLLNTDITKLV